MVILFTCMHMLFGDIRLFFAAGKRKKSEVVKGELNPVWNAVSDKNV